MDMQPPASIPFAASKTPSESVGTKYLINPFLWRLEEYKGKRTHFAV